MVCGSYKIRSGFTEPVCVLVEIHEEKMLRSICFGYQEHFDDVFWHNSKIYIASVEAALTTKRA